jgi:hypothetical protein
MSGSATTIRVAVSHNAADGGAGNPFNHVARDRTGHAELSQFAWMRPGLAE